MDYENIEKNQKYLKLPSDTNFSHCSNLPIIKLFGYDNIKHLLHDSSALVAIVGFILISEINLSHNSSEIAFSYILMNSAIYLYLYI